ncbi:MAG: DUF1559 domain-containing protein [Planctomycetaceae bacterium]|nr:DUF1559 domain-containing protein [Planctomycetaceae bacterium]
MNINTLTKLFVVVGVVVILTAVLLLRPNRVPCHVRHLCIANSHRIDIALRDYQGRYGVFPPAYVTDADGKPLYSWRVLILPFLEEQELYNQFKLDEPWDSEANRKLLDACPSVYRCPQANAKPGMATYAMVVGPGTISDGPNSVSLEEITDGPARTILLAETLKRIPWTAPIDIPLSTLEAGIDPHGGGIGSNHPGLAVVVFADRSVRPIYDEIKPETLRALATIADGEVIDTNKL